MEQIYKKDGTSLNIMTEEDMKEINLVPYINTSNWYYIQTAYCINRVVTIALLIRSGTTDVKRTQLINDEKFYPLVDASGFVNIQSSVNDVGKILDTKLHSNGEIYIWIKEALSYGELVTFIYPLKS